VTALLHDLLPAALVLAAVLGLVIGSFLTVVAWRVPRGQSVSHPPSACPNCGHRLSAWENVPVLSFAVLRARCRSCRAPISWRYPIVEVATSGLFVLVVLRFGVDVDTVAFLYLAAISVALCLIDIEHRIRRQHDALPAYPVLLALLAAAAAASGDGGALLRAALGGAALFAFYFAVAFAYPAGMGFGDVKLAGVLGIALAWVGWDALIVGAFAAFVIGSVGGVAVAVVRRTGRKTAIPFGPSMLLGAAVGVAAGPHLAGGYLGLFGL
jgi:leader peptidase (prepilin peptidase)/N-methyltransferase